MKFLRNPAALKMSLEFLDHSLIQLLSPAWTSAEPALERRTAEPCGSRGMNYTRLVHHICSGDLRRQTWKRMFNGELEQLEKAVQSGSKSFVGRMV